MFGFAKTQMVSPEKALPGRDEPIPVPPRHEVLDAPLAPPYPDGAEIAEFALGCFWGAERTFWQTPGVVSTAVGYEGGHTPNPTYEEVCSGLTGHTETVRVVYDPTKITYEELLQGNDIGTQYRSAIFYRTDAQQKAAETSRDAYQQVLTKAGYGPITTEITKATDFYFAEDYHQQYLSKNPNGYCGIGGTGVSCPVGVASAE